MMCSARGYVAMRHCPHRRYPPSAYERCSHHNRSVAGHIAVLQRAWNLCTGDVGPQKGGCSSTGNPVPTIRSFTGVHVRLGPPGPMARQTSGPGGPAGRALRPGPYRTLIERLRTRPCESCTELSTLSGQRIRSPREQTTPRVHQAPYRITMKPVCGTCAALDRTQLALAQDTGRDRGKQGCAQASTRHAQPDSSNQASECSDVWFLCATMRGRERAGLARGSNLA